jgi:hypothetical protein
MSKGVESHGHQYCASELTSHCCLQVEDEELPAHRIILTARSPVFRALLNSDMREGKEGVVVIEDVRAPVFRALLHFVYTDALPEVRSCIPTSCCLIYMPA